MYVLMLFLVLGKHKGAPKIQTPKPILTITPPPETGIETLRLCQPNLKFIHQLIWNFWNSESYQLFADVVKLYCFLLSFEKIQQITTIQWKNADFQFKNSSTKTYSPVDLKISVHYIKLISSDNIDTHLHTYFK